MRPRLFGWILPLLAAMTLAFGLLPSHAQSPPVGTPPGLVLSPAQKARAQARQQQYIKDATALQANKSLTPAQKTAKGTALYKAMDADMLAILTPKQRAQVLAARKAQAPKLQAMMQQRQAFMKAHQAEIDQGQALAKKLSKSLTPQQQQQIQTIRQQFSASAGPKAQQIMSNQSLSTQAKQQQMLQLEQELDGKIGAVLTPSQKADYNKLTLLQRQLQAEAGAAGQAK